jgi:hypothetical protein
MRCLVFSTAGSAREPGRPRVQRLASYTDAEEGAYAAAAAVRGHDADGIIPVTSTGGAVIDVA